jgi:hypothetical protein
MTNFEILDGSLRYDQLKNATAGSFFWPGTEMPYEQTKIPYSGFMHF